jgi:glycine C-acetyltransferase
LRQFPWVTSSSSESPSRSASGRIDPLPVVDERCYEAAVRRKPVVLVTGANGEMGHGLIHKLSELGSYEVLALDIKEIDPAIAKRCSATIVGDILNRHLLERLVSEFEIHTIFHLAALLSTRSEFTPETAHEVNVTGTLNLLKMAHDQSRWHGKQVTFLFPSSIAVYGLPDLANKQRAGKVSESEWTVPTTMYGCNKLYCEQLGRYFARHYRQLAHGEEKKGVDFRSIRFPGLISAFTQPSGGTSDYLPEMIHAAAQGRPYECFVREDTRISFMAMPDAIDALLGLMAAPASALRSHVYNIAAMNPSAGEFAELVREAFPGAEISFVPDTKRQAIVDSWPEEIDDYAARRDWKFSPAFDLRRMVNDYLLPNIRTLYEGQEGLSVVSEDRPMMNEATKARFSADLTSIEADGLYKRERLIEGPQGAVVSVGGTEVLNFCANNYLGLGNAPRLVAAAKEGLDSFGFGLASVRFICGTQTLHKQLEGALSRFLGQEDTILYTSCFDANGGLFETLTGPDDAILSDALNHASIIDGIRLAKAERHRYANGDMAELERLLQATAGKRLRLISTDGVFSMDGYVAKLGEICDLAEKYDALVHVDDSHATGFFGPTGRGSIEHCGVMDRVDLVTSTLGKALGGASGGFTSGRQVLIDLLRQRSRPYLFSNTVAPAIASASLACLTMLSETTALRDRLESNTRRFRSAMTAAGFQIKEGVHPIVPVMVGDAKLAQEVATAMLAEGIYVVGFFYPVVPKGQARIRVQISAAHDEAQIDRCVAAFVRVGERLGLLPTP